MCEQANIETAQLLAKDTKTCPSCGTLIFKISGCDQIWCTQCHTAFNWRTQQIEKGVIHNPHYYEYLRRHGGAQRTPGDIPCGGLPTYNELTTRLHKLRYTEVELRYIAIRVHQWIHHLHYGGVIERYRETTPEEMRKLRVQFMLKDLSELDYKRRLQQIEKMENKRSEIRDVIVLYRAVGTEILQKIAAHPEGYYISELTGLRDHCLELLDGVKKRWGCAISDVIF
jgi:hypothetical protein